MKKTIHYEQEYRSIEDGWIRLHNKFVTTEEVEKNNMLFQRSVLPSLRTVKVTTIRKVVKQKKKKAKG